MSTENMKTQIDTAVTNGTSESFANGLEAYEPESRRASEDNNSVDGHSVPSTRQPVPEEENVVARKLMGFVGFSNLPTQYHRRSLQNGFDFNIMCIGSSGLGKTTLIDTLFNFDGYKERRNPYESLDATRATVAIQTTSQTISEGGVTLRLNIVDTPGFGDHINNDNCWQTILSDVERRFDDYLAAEASTYGFKIKDERIHAALYFIEPSGHSLSAIDIEVMKRLHRRVNLIPVVAKSDTLSDEELTGFKQRIMADIAQHHISIFQIDQHKDDDDETVAENNEIVSRFPFAVVGSTQFVKLPDGSHVRGRQYPWGVLQVDNAEHSDFPIMKQMLIRTHMEDLKERTADVLYEQYRTDKLIRQGITQDNTVFRSTNPAARVAEQRQAQEQRLQRLETEMRSVFTQKVQEKEQKLKASEEELYERHREMKDTLLRRAAELRDKKERIQMELASRPAEPEKSSKKKGFSLR